MGLFDVSINKKLKSKTILDKLKVELSSSSKDVSSTSNQLICKSYKIPKSLLRYDLDIKLNNNELSIEGELQDVIFLVVLIVLGILFTYGVLVIVVAAYALLQKRITQKTIEAILKKIE